MSRIDPIVDQFDTQASARPSASRKTFSDSVDAVIFCGLLAGLAAAPFWLGGNRPVAWAINAMWACGLVALYEVRIAASGGTHPVALRRIWPAIVALVTTIGWCLVQVSTRVPLELQHPIWGMAREALGLNIAGSISVQRDATVLALLRLVTSASAFWLALQLCRSPVRARLLIQGIVIIGFAYALYGLVAFFLFPKSLLWIEKVHYVDSLTSTFVNRNSYATYAAIGLIASVGVTVSAFAAQAAGGSSARRAAGFVASLTGGAGLWLAITIVIAMALILTASRGGITAGLLGLVVGAIVSIMQRRGRRGPAAIAGIFAVLAVLAVGVVFGDLLAARIASHGFQSDDRLAAYAITMTSIADRPLLGFGYGTFEHVFPMYRDASVGPFGTWDKAHNTYLEVVQGLGIPVAALLFAGVAFLVWRCFFGALGRRRSVTVPLVASAASITALAHAFADFSLQIQGVTLTWMALLGAGVAQSWSSETDTS